MPAEIKRAMAITARVNRLAFGDAAEVRALFCERAGMQVDDGGLPIPPFQATGGTGTRIGNNVFINQNCTLYDLGVPEIGDDAMIGPNVCLIRSGHPVEPSARLRRCEADRDRTERVDRFRRDGHRRRDGRREFDRRGRRRRYPRRSREYAGRRQSGSGCPGDRRVTSSGSTRRCDGPASGRCGQLAQQPLETLCIRTVSVPPRPIGQAFPAFPGHAARMGARQAEEDRCVRPVVDILASKRLAALWISPVRMAGYRAMREEGCGQLAARRSEML
ncbi:transferase [Burkholderia paludis]|uniref:Transferase n=1 Tax=Burkholderia paludis TaxID=1506587 RepID=A0A6J5EKH1_9BURK|nr:hypothetical protein LMG30113_05372 [Burkholderia paludis]VWB68429.1 transferase [Burkholderia paludis]